jgi:hypothetical protein
LVYTTIRIEVELRDELKRIGRKGETYTEIIKRLLKEASNPNVNSDERKRISALMPSDLG